MKRSAFVRRSAGAGGDAAEESGAAPSKELPRGCFASVHNGAQLLTSLGLHEWDELSGGGALVGGMYLIEGDTDTRHWKSLVRYYAGEALALQQALLVVGALDYAPEAFVRAELPLEVASQPVDRIVETSQSLQSTTDGIKIAWRYKAQIAERPLGGSDAVAAAQTARRAHHFDLGKTAPASATAGTLTIMKTRDDDCDAVLRRVAVALREHTAAQLASAERAVPILRVVLLNFGSGLWANSNNSGSGDAALAQLRMLSQLRAVLRGSLATCLVAMPRVAVTPAVRHCFDHAVALTEFNADEPNVYTGFHGVLTLQRLPTLFAAVPSFRPDCKQYLFRRTKRRLHLERIFLPPADAGESSQLGCATSGGSGGGALDF